MIVVKMDIMHIANAQIGEATDGRPCAGITSVRASKGKNLICNQETETRDKTFKLDWWVQMLSAFIQYR